MIQAVAVRSGDRNDVRRRQTEQATDLSGFQAEVLALLVRNQRPLELGNRLDLLGVGHADNHPTSVAGLFQFLPEGLEIDRKIPLVGPAEITDESALGQEIRIQCPIFPVPLDGLPQPGGIDKREVGSPAPESHSPEKPETIVPADQMINGLFQGDLDFELHGKLLVLLFYEYFNNSPVKRPVGSTGSICRHVPHGAIVYWDRFLIKS